MRKRDDDIIYVEDVRKAFQSNQVLNGVDLQVQRGSIFALLGSNGAGKTTLINILTTLLQADSGKVQLGGYDVQKEMDEAKKQFSLTGQFAATDDVLTGRNNLQLIGELNHLAGIEAKTDELLAAFDLSDVGNQAVSTYSGGMRRRLDIAMSMMSSPAIIFLDEPTTGLDPQNRSAMWELVKSLSDSGTTIFLTTQYLEEAEQLADQIAILHEGKIVKTGTPEELKRMLPQGVVEFSFQKPTDLLAAAKLLQHFEQVENRESLTLTVVTDGSLTQLIDAMNRLQQESIVLGSFTQKLPTLEDVFYAIINEDSEVMSR